MWARPDAYAVSAEPRVSVHEPYWDTRKEGKNTNEKKKKTATHLDYRRRFADESALAETSVSAPDFSSPRSLVRRSCMGSLR